MKARQAQHEIFYCFIPPTPLHPTPYPEVVLQITGVKEEL